MLPSRYELNFTPAVLASAGITLAADYNAQTGVTVSTGTISAWADQSGNGNHLAKGTTGPTLKSGSSINGRNAAKFAVSTNWLTKSSPVGVPTAASPKTLFCVMQMPATPSGAVVPLTIDDASGGFSIVVDIGGLVGVFVQGLFSTYYSTTLAANTPCVVVITDNGIGQATAIINGIVCTGGAYTAPVAAAVTGLRVGSKGQTDGTVITGDIARVGVFNGVISASAAVRLANHLMAFYGVLP